VILKKSILSLTLGFLFFFPLKSQTMYDTSMLYEHKTGLEKAPVEMIVYFAFTCTHCKKWHDEVLPKLDEKYIKPGKLKIIFKDVPIDKTSYTTSVVAHCQKGEAYKGLLEIIFKHQERILGSLEEADEDKNYEEAMKFVYKNATLAGLNVKKIEQCINDQILKDSVMNRLRESRDRYGFQGTPSFVIQNQPYAKYMSYEDIEKILEGLLKPSAPPLKSEQSTQKKTGSLEKVWNRLQNFFGLN
jgi:protein-disulfide isomerase